MKITNNIIILEIAAQLFSMTSKLFCFVRIFFDINKGYPARCEIRLLVGQSWKYQFRSKGARYLKQHLGSAN